MRVIRLVVLPLVLVACATFVRISMLPLLNGRPLLAMFLIPIIISGAITGGWSALIGTGFAMWATEVFIMQPTWLRREQLPVDTYEQVVLLIAGLTVAARCFVQHRDRERAFIGEQRLRIAMNHLGPTMFLLLLAPDGRVLEVSQRGYRQSQLNPKDVIGVRLNETYWWTWSKAVSEQLGVALDQAANGIGSRYTVQVRIGPVLRWVDFTLTPVFDDDGTVCYLVPSGSFIDERLIPPAA